jgi:hypothetical protein
MSANFAAFYLAFKLVPVAGKRTVGQAPMTEEAIG